MPKKMLGISLLATIVLIVGVGLGLNWMSNASQPTTALADLSWQHPAFAASASAPPHGSAPGLTCWQCHGSHPPKTAPPVSGMTCFKCHTIK